MTYRHRAFATGGTLFLALLTFTSYAGAQTLKTLYSFSGGTDGGASFSTPAIGNLGYSMAPRVGTRPAAWCSR